MKKLPNILTVLRVVFTPILLYLIIVAESKSAKITTALFFALLAFTDFLDGYIAHKYNCFSEFGRIIDPIADKILVSTVLIVLLSKDLLPIFLVLILISRELFVSGLREFMSLKKIIPVSNVAKLKTLTQLVGIFIVLIGNDYGFNAIFIGNLTLSLAAVFSLYSAYEYSYPILRF